MGIERYLLNYAGLAVTLLLLAACDGGPTSTGNSVETPSPVVLFRGNGGDPQTLDPALADDIHSFGVLLDLYEGLVTEAADGSLAPGVAGRWEISADGLRYTFHLQEDARWSDGRQVVADDFVSAFRRLMAPGSESPYSFFFDSLKNAAAVTSGELPAERLGVRATDTTTLTIELSQPSAYLLRLLATPAAFPLAAGALERDNAFRDPAAFVGNGPYLLREWSPGYRIRLAKNPLFRDANLVRIDEVEYLPIANPTSELNRFRSGELDLTFTVPTEQIPALRRKYSEELRIAPSLAVYYFAFDLSEPPFDKPDLRQALSMAIDRQALVDLLGRGEQPAHGIVPPGVSGHVPATHAWSRMPRDGQRAIAKDLYRRAGFSEEQPLQFILTYDVGDVHEKIALAAVDMWREVLGAEVGLDRREWKYFLDTRGNRADWQMMRFAWFGDYNDASTFTDIFRSDSPQNLPGIEDSEFDGLLDEAAATLDRAIRTSLMTRAEQRLLDEHAVIPLYFFVSKHLVSPTVKGFEPNVLDRHPSRYLSKENSN